MGIVSRIVTVGICCALAVAMVMSVLDERTKPIAEGVGVPVYN